MGNEEWDAGEQRVKRLTLHGVSGVSNRFDWSGRIHERAFLVPPDYRARVLMVFACSRRRIFETSSAAHLRGSVVTHH
ncbi:hypothetical protein ACLUWV_01665 [Bifidobacterium thermophilum]|uniref:hypothetical protein n=1 Tax=Bifidobacterium thermophilum TaxID=33905 RepID=UPI0039949078